MRHKIPATIAISVCIPNIGSGFIRFINIPKNAQTITKPYARSLLEIIIIEVIIVATIKTKIVQIISDIPKPSQPISTSNAVIFAIVATVIQPRYTLNGT